MTRRQWWAVTARRINVLLGADPDRRLYLRDFCVYTRAGGVQVATMSHWAMPHRGGRGAAPDRLVIRGGHVTTDE